MCAVHHVHVCGFYLPDTHHDPLHKQHNGAQHTANYNTQLLLNLNTKKILLLQVGAEATILLQHLHILVRLSCTKNRIPTNTSTNYFSLKIAKYFKLLLYVTTVES